MEGHAEHVLKETVNLLDKSIHHQSRRNRLVWMVINFLLKVSSAHENWHFKAQIVLAMLVHGQNW